ncbi:MAG: hypothetical protein A3H42_03075 [Deltaproteobacteria bacterium RIFCSPLOWO2_02_FULL_46_8]|nr:MAG: hypothetical protein A3H42_03075 [Deltaproteobacteria bacterium RIFCSPLOWO2_02_FULL_46_8]
MDSKTFKKFFEEHRDKISEAWIKLSDADLKMINGNLDLFLKTVSAIYKVPNEVILKELRAVQKNIEEGINTDYSPRLDPRE